MPARWLIAAIDVAARRLRIVAILRRATRRAMLIALSILLWLVAVGFALAALTIWLSLGVGVVAACGIVAGACAVVGLGLQLAAHAASSDSR